MSRRKLCDAHRLEQTSSRIIPDGGFLLVPRVLDTAFFVLYSLGGTSIEKPARDDLAGFVDGIGGCDQL